VAPILLQCLYVALMLGLASYLLLAPRPEEIVELEADEECMVEAFDGAPRDVRVKTAANRTEFGNSDTTIHRRERRRVRKRTNAAEAENVFGSTSAFGGGGKGLGFKSAVAAASNRFASRVNKTGSGAYDRGWMRFSQLMAKCWR